MKTKRLKIFQYIFISFLSLIGFVHADWHDRKAEGWVWFEEKEDPKISKKTEEPFPIEKPIPEEVKSKIIKKDQEKELEAFKKELERSLKVATWDPKPENVAVYQRMQLIALEKSIEFGRIWQQNLLNQPALDASIESPSSYYGTQLQKTLRHQEKENRLHELAKNYGLLFFYEGASLSSQATAEIVKNFANKYQFELYGLSHDQHLIEGIQNQSLGQQFIDSLKLTIFPSLYLVDPDNNRLIPIAYGMVAQEKIEDNILMQLPKALNE